MDVMEQLVKIYRESHLGRRLPAYDGRKSLYTAGPLPFSNKDFSITLIDEDAGTGAPRRERQFKVVIKYAAQADLHHLGMFLQGKQADAPQEALQVLDIVLRELPTSSFPVDERGTMKSVVQYFDETYGFSIQHTHWSCLQVGNQQRPNYLPMEVCKIVEGQRYSKRLNERQITALLKVTCQRPQEREKDIMQTVRHNAYHEDPYTKEFGIKISDKLAQVEARILPAPWVNKLTLLPR